jgi:hypothetical protein
MAIRAMIDIHVWTRVKEGPDISFVSCAAGFWEQKNMTTYIWKRALSLGYTHASWMSKETAEDVRGKVNVQLRTKFESVGNGLGDQSGSHFTEFLIGDPNNN